MIQNLITASGENHDPEVVAYGIDVIYSGIASFVILLLAGWVSHHLPETLIYIVSHFLLVRLMGGYHSHTRLGCTVLTIASCFLCIWISDMVWEWIPAGGVAILCLLYLCSVFLMAPAENPAKVIEECTRIKNRNRSLLYMTAASFLVMIFWMIDRKTACVFWINMTEIVISMLVGKEVNAHVKRKSGKIAG